MSANIAQNRVPHERQYFCVSASVRFLKIPVLLSLSCTIPGFATTIHLRSIQELTTDSDVILRAVPRPNSSRSHWDTNHEMIMTHTTFRVLETFYGNVKPGTEIVVETFGGLIPEEQIEMYIPGSPIFAADEEVVLFLHHKLDSQEFRIIDLAAGKFELSIKNHTTVVTRRDLGAAEIVAAPSPAPRTLSHLRAAIKAAVARKQAESQGQPKKESNK